MMKVPAAIATLLEEGTEKKKKTGYLWSSCVLHTVAITREWTNNNFGGAILQDNRLVSETQQLWNLDVIIPLSVLF